MSLKQFKCYIGYDITNLAPAFNGERKKSSTAFSILSTLSYQINLQTLFLYMANSFLTRTFLLLLLLLPIIENFRNFLSFKLVKLLHSDWNWNGIIKRKLYLLWDGPSKPIILYSFWITRGVSVVSDCYHFYFQVFIGVTTIFGRIHKFSVRMMRNDKKTSIAISKRRW